MTNKLFSVVKRYRNGSEPMFIQGDLTYEDAKKIVNSFPDSQETMVTMSQQKEESWENKTIPTSYKIDIPGYHDDDYYEEPQNEMTHSQQCASDRMGYAKEQLERGNICPIQAAEMACGA
tara:strand:- start:322 stop:681 length:360 start_codon:yes stop_codon:yes gene_type:complete